MFIESIEIKGFRGLRDFAYNFEKDKALLIHGLNGTGKSSLFQALGFVVTGQLPPVSCVEPSSPALYCHKGLDKTINAYVRLTFRHNGSSYEIRREIPSNGKIKTLLSDPEAINLCRDKINQFCFLTRSDFVSMIDAVERDSWQRITPFLGFDEIVRLREGLRALNVTIRKLLGATQAEQSLRTDKINLAEAQKRYSASLAQLALETSSPEIIGVELEKLIDKELHFCNYEEIPWDQIQRQLPGADRLKAISIELQALTREQTVCQIPKVPSDKLQDSLQFLAVLHNDSDLGHELLHFKFFEYSNSVIKDYASEPCPLCGMKPDNWDDVRSGLTQKILELRETQNNFSDAHNCLRTYLSSISTVIENIKESSSKKQEQSDFYDSLLKFKDVIDLALNRLGTQPARGLSDQQIATFEAARSLVNESLMVLKKCLIDAQERLTKEQAEYAENPALQGFYKLRELVDSHIAFTKAQLKLKQSDALTKEIEHVVTKMQGFYKIIDNAESELSAELLLHLETELKRIFCILTDQHNLLPAIRLKTERGIRAAEITISDFHGLGPVSARDYLSEANRNSIGLAIYFAGLQLRFPKLQALVMDDITHSCDNNHRRGLASFIINELANRLQLVILTHDKNWHERLFQTLTRQKSASLKVIDWSLDGMTYESDNWSSLLDKASDKILKHDFTGGNALRQAFEQFMNAICERLKIEFPYKEEMSQIQLNDKRQRLESAITKAWRTGQGIIDPNKPAIRLLLNSQQITNLSSHYGSYETWDYQDLLDTLKDVKCILDTFTCKNLHNGTVCGNLLNMLRKTNNSMPKCSRCGNEFLL